MGAIEITKEAVARELNCLRAEAQRETRSESDSESRDGRQRVLNEARDARAHTLALTLSLELFHGA